MHPFSAKTLTAVCALLAAAPGHAHAAGPPPQTVKVQTGDHTEGFTRLVVRVPDGARASVTRESCAGRIALDTPAAWPLDRLNDTYTVRLSGYHAPDDRTLAFAWPCGAQVKTIRERQLLILDVQGALLPARKPATQTAASPPEKGSGEGDPPIPRTPTETAVLSPPEKGSGEGDRGSSVAAEAPPTPPVPPAKGSEPIGPFDLAAWAGDDFRERERALQATVSDADGPARVDALVALARFRLAWALPEEGRAAVEAAGALAPTAAQAHELRLLADAFAVLDGTADPETSVFARPGPASSPDHAVWRAGALVTRWTQARRDLPAALKRLRAYPAEPRARLLDRFAEAAGAADPTALELVVLDMLTLETRPGDRRLDLHRARLAELRGQADAALDLYERAAQGDGPHARRAQVRAVELRRAAGMLDDEGAIAALESLRYAWRGDAVEAEALTALGQAYARAGRTDAALDVFALLGRRFGATARGQAAIAAARDLVAAVLDRMEGEPPGTGSLTLHVRHGALLARLDGADGGFRRRVADLLARDGFTVEAARAHHALLEHAAGAERARLGLRLARLLADGGRPGDALDTLAGTADPAAAPELVGERALLRAEALLADGDPAGALDAVRGLPGAEAARLRALSLFRAGEWAAARAAFAEIAGQPDGTPDDVALLALAAARTGDREALALAGARRDQLAGTRWAGLVEALADDAGAAGPPGGAAVARQLAAADALAALFARWRTTPPENPR